MASFDPRLELARKLYQQRQIPAVPQQRAVTSLQDVMSRNSSLPPLSDKAMRTSVESSSLAQTLRDRYPSAGGQIDAALAGEKKGGLLNNLIDNPISKAALGALEPLKYIGYAGKTIVSSVDQLYSAIDGNPETKTVGLGELFGRADDPKYGFGTSSIGKALKTGNKWVDRAVGFIGDVGLDPLTYVTFGAGRFAGEAGRFAAANKIIQLGDDAERFSRAAKVAREGISAASAADRALIGANKTGLYFFGKRLNAVPIPGTRTIGGAVEKKFSRIRLAASDSRMGKALSRGFTPTDAKTLRLALKQGSITEPEKIAQALALVQSRTTQRAANGLARTVATKELGDWVGSNLDDLRVYGANLHEVMEGSRPAANAVEARLAQEAQEGLPGVWRGMRGLRDEIDGEVNAINDGINGVGTVDDYFPHMQTREAIKYKSNDSNPFASELNNSFRPHDLDPAASYKSRQLEVGDTFFGTKIVSVDDLRVNRLNKIANDAGFEGNFFETDLVAVLNKYVDNFASQKGINARALALKEAGVFKGIEAKLDVVEYDTEIINATVKRVNNLESARDAALKQAGDAQAGVVDAVQKSLDDLALAERSALDEVVGVGERVFAAEQNLAGSRQAFVQAANSMREAQQELVDIFNGVLPPVAQAQNEMLARLEERMRIVASRMEGLSAQSNRADVQKLVDEASEIGAEIATLRSVNDATFEFSNTLNKSYENIVNGVVKNTGKNQGEIQRLGRLVGSLPNDRATVLGKEAAADSTYKQWVDGRAATLPYWEEVTGGTAPLSRAQVKNLSLDEIDDIAVRGSSNAIPLRDVRAAGVAALTRDEYFFLDNLPASLAPHRERLLNALRVANGAERSQAELANVGSRVSTVLEAQQQQALRRAEYLEREIPSSVAETNRLAQVNPSTPLTDDMRNVLVDRFPFLESALFPDSSLDGYIVQRQYEDLMDATLEVDGALANQIDRSFDPTQAVTESRRSFETVGDVVSFLQRRNNMLENETLSWGQGVSKVEVGYRDAIDRLGKGAPIQSKRAVTKSVADAKVELADALMTYSMMSESFKRMSAVTDLLMSHGMLPNERIFRDVLRNVATPHVENWLARRAEIGQAAEVVEQVKKRFYDILSPTHPNHNPAYVGREHDLLRDLFNEVFDGSFKIRGEAQYQNIPEQFDIFTNDRAILARAEIDLGRRPTSGKASDEWEENFNAWVEEENLRVIQQNFPDAEMYRNENGVALYRRPFVTGEDLSANGQAVARILGPAFATFEDPANLLNRLRALSRATTKATRQADEAAGGYEVTDIFKSLQEGAAKNETLQSFERDRLIPWFKSIKGENARYSRKAARELLKIHKAEGSVFAQAATRSDFDRFFRDILGGDIARVGSAVNRYGTQESAIGFRRIPGNLNEEFERASSALGMLRRMQDPQTNVRAFIDDPSNPNLTTANQYADMIGDLATQYENAAQRVAGRPATKAELKRAEARVATAKRIRDGGVTVDGELVPDNRPWVLKGRLLNQKYKDLINTPEYMAASSEQEFFDQLQRLAAYDLHRARLGNGSPLREVFTESEWESLFVGRVTKQKQQQAAASVTRLQKQLDSLNKSLGVETRKQRRPIGGRQYDAQDEVVGTIRASRDRVKAELAQAKRTQEVMNQTTQSVAFGKARRLLKGDGVNPTLFADGVKPREDAWLSKYQTADVATIEARRAGATAAWTNSKDELLVRRANVLAQDANRLRVEQATSDLTMLQRTAGGLRAQLAAIEGLRFSDAGLENLPDDLRGVVGGLQTQARTAARAGEDVGALLRSTQSSLRNTADLTGQAPARIDDRIQAPIDDLTAQRNAVLEQASAGAALGREIDDSIDSQMALAQQTLDTLGQSVKTVQGLVEDTVKVVVSERQKVFNRINGTVSQKVKDQLSDPELYAKVQKYVDAQNAAVQAGKAVPRPPKGVTKELVDAVKSGSFGLRSAEARAALDLLDSQSLYDSARATQVGTEELVQLVYPSLVAKRNQVQSLLDSAPLSVRGYVLPEGVAGPRLGAVAPKTEAEVEALRSWIAQTNAALKAMDFDPNDPVARAVLAATHAEGNFIVADLSLKGGQDALRTLKEGTVITNVIQPFADDFEKQLRKIGQIGKDEASLKDLGFPGLKANQDVVDIFNNLRRIQKSSVAEELARFMGTYTNFFKGYATLSPGFHIRNSISNTFMLFAAGADIKSLKTGLSIYRSFQDSVDKRVPMATWLESLPQAQRGQARVAVMTWAAMGGGRTDDALRNLIREGSFLTDNRALRASRKFGDKVEGSARFMLAYDSAAKGMDFETSFARVKRFLFDYSDIGTTDQALRQVVPFWMWMSRNFPVQAVNQITNPKAYLIYNKFKENVNEPLEEGDVVPQYLLDQGAINLGGDNFLTPDLGFNRLKQQVQEIKDPVRLASYLNPAFRLLPELAGSRKFYNGAPFSDKPIPLKGKWAPLEPLFALFNQVSTNEAGEKFVTEKAIYTVTSLFPMSGQAERLFPDTPGYEGRAGASRLSYIGVPIKKNTDRMKEGVVYGRLKALQDLEKRLKSNNAAQ